MMNNDSKCKMSMDFYQNMQYYNPESVTLHKIRFLVLQNNANALQNKEFNLMSHTHTQKPLNYIAGLPAWENLQLVHT
jgi:hypothetical protein